MRRPLVKKWELERTAPWDMARPGASALDAAHDRGIEAELAMHTGESVGALLWGFAKFSDHMDGQLLLEAGLELGLP